ncbi:PAAR domain-containing protein [Burkholderia sp. Ax-1724]|uniref:PAAR domain-containing protein n=1 Tax=Burkholderia sp. Ax-1724 TaxID=2608336 RepID=UPI0031F5B54F|nr:PAAR domain-containing protein [Burkholderia sp. Ax-1724]
MKRYLILDGDYTTASGTVHASPTSLSFGSRRVAHEGDDIACPACNSTGRIKCDGPRLTMPGPAGRCTALSDDLCICKCDPPPKLVASQQAMSVDV